MLTALIPILLLAVVLLIVWWILGQFLPANINNVIGVIFGLVLLIVAIQKLGLLTG